MRHQRRTSEIVKRSAHDVFMEAKRRFQYKPGPSRKPHVHDIVSKSKVKSHTSMQLEPEQKVQKMTVKEINKQNVIEKNTKQDKSKNEQQVKQMIKDALIDAQSINISLTESQDIKPIKEKTVQKVVSQLPKKAVQTKPYYVSQLSYKNKLSKSKENIRNISMELKGQKQKQVIKQVMLPRQSKPLTQRKINNSLNSSISMLSKTKADPIKKMSTSIDFLGITQPTTITTNTKENFEIKKASLDQVQISLTQFDIQVESIKQPETLFQNYESNIKKKYKYDIEEYIPQSKHQSVLSLSPVKGYSFDKQPDQQTRKKKQSVQLFGSIREPIIQQQDDKILDSRVLQTKCTEIYQALDSKRLGILDRNNSSNTINLHPDIKYLIDPIVSKIKHQNKSFNKKEFLIEIKRIMLHMRDKQGQKIMKCPIYNKLQQRKYSVDHVIKPHDKQDKPLKQISKQPYMRLNTRNSVGDIELSQLSLHDSLQRSPQNQFKTDRLNQPRPILSWQRAIQSQIQVSRIDALNQRLNAYIIKNNINQNRYTSNQINLDFFELKKNLGHD